MRELDLVIKKAKETRKLCLEYADRWCKDLCGYCATASVHLWRELHYHEIPAELVFNSYHCFVKYKGYIIDVTAKQFDHKHRAVHVAKVPQDNKFYYWKEKNTIKNINDLRPHHWPWECKDDLRDFYAAKNYSKSTKTRRRLQK